jgi:hypothetical protein
MSLNKLFRSFFVACRSPLSYKGIGTRRALNTNAPLTLSPTRQAIWLRQLYPPAKGASQTRSQLSGARSWSESKSQQWTMIAPLGLCSKTEHISDSMLSRSFGSHRIFPIGRLTTIAELSGGHLSARNNQTRITNHEPACNGRVLSCVAGGVR